MVEVNWPQETRKGELEARKEAESAPQSGRNFSANLATQQRTEKTAALLRCTRTSASRSGTTFCADNSNSIQLLHLPDAARAATLGSPKWPASNSSLIYFHQPANSPVGQTLGAQQWAGT